VSDPQDPLVAVMPAASSSSTPAAAATAEEDEIPKWPIYAFIGVVFIGMPLMPTAKGGGAFGKFVDVVYRRVGATGLLAIPFGSLTVEKATYDTYCAYHGKSIYEEKESNPHGGFPSGGAALPSFSMLKTRDVGRDERAIFRNGALDWVWCQLRGYGP